MQPTGSNSALTFKAQRLIANQQFVSATRTTKGNLISQTQHRAMVNALLQVAATNPEMHNFVASKLARDPMARAYAAQLYASAPSTNAQLQNHARRLGFTQPGTQNFGNYPLGQNKTANTALNNKMTAAKSQKQVDNATMRQVGLDATHLNGINQLPTINATQVREGVLLTDTAIASAALATVGVATLEKFKDGFEQAHSRGDALRRDEAADERVKAEIRNIEGLIAEIHHEREIGANKQADEHAELVQSLASGIDAPGAINQNEIEVLKESTQTTATAEVAAGRVIADTHAKDASQSGEDPMMTKVIEALSSAVKLTMGISALALGTVGSVAAINRPFEVTVEAGSPSFASEAGVVSRGNADLGSLVDNSPGLEISLPGLPE